MTRITALLLLAFAAGACASRPPAPAAEAESPDAAACRAEARVAPEVRAAGRQFNPGNPANAARVRQEQEAAQTRAFRNCMVRRGAALPGGVEPVRRPMF
jgi:hypothetical protein